MKAKLADLVVVGDKVKAPALAVVREVDVHGDEIPVAQVAAVEPNG